jgi:MFS family permease
LTAGLVLTVTLVAFESLAISTVMPVVADDLGGLRLYGWVFSGFFLGSLMGIVVAGQLADERGTRLPFLIGLSCFAVGLAVGATAGSMGVLVAGRVAQGFGAGAIPAVAYVSVGRAYPADAQPRVFAVFSTAWVIPALVGPAAASGLAEAWSWRAVFGALLPLVGLAAAMTVPALTTSRPAEGDAGAGSAAPPIRDRRLDALVLVAGAAAVLAGLGAGTPVIGAALVVGGAIPAVRAFIRLVPPGTLRVIAGLPAAVAVRGLLTFAFFGADAYVSLTLTEVRHTSTWMAGIPLTTASLAWAGGAWVQQREIAVRGPQWLVRRGFLLVALGIGGMLVVLHPVPVGVAVLAWSVAGLGMGLSFAPLSVTVLGLSEPGQEGASSSSLQLSDVLGVSLGTGLSGVFVALGEGRGWAVGSSLTLAFVVMLAVALVGAWAAGRLPRGLSGAAGHGDRTAEHRLSA